MTNFKLIIEYDGSKYHGWQRQAHEPTIQSELETAIQIMVQQPVTLIASGRTDAGVHARGQVAHFHCQTRLSPAQLHRGLNSLLPDDIVIRECVDAPDSFHARYDARGKIYHYHILNNTIPISIGRQYIWHIERPLDAGQMALGIKALIGTHDFKAFESTGSTRDHSIRTIFDATIHVERDRRMIIEIFGNGFLRCMVRNIVGTLVDVGTGRLQPDRIEHILKSRNRQQAGTTAPPHGLFLMQVLYDPNQQYG
jgi:tRNA pseudouridine38-40 synthase